MENLTMSYDGEIACCTGGKDFLIEALRAEIRELVHRGDVLSLEFLRIAETLKTLGARLEKAEAAQGLLELQEMDEVEEAVVVEHLEEVEEPQGGGKSRD